MQRKQINKRLTGVVVPVGALRSRQGMGVGEFSDLVVFANFCKKMKLGLIQLLPVNDTGYQSSPYFSLTAFALHPLYLRIEELEEFKRANVSVKKRIKEAKNKFCKAERFSHYNILKEKLEICRELYDANLMNIYKSASNGSLSKWIEQNLWVKEYAVYRRLKEENGGKSWKEWPEHQTVSPADIERIWKEKTFYEDHLFWAWIQEALDVQFSRAAKVIAERGIVLEGDLPILMNEDSCDVWAHPELFDQELSAGAPPDMYSPEGQNWGFPVYNWKAHENDNFSWWRRRLAVAGKYYQAYRIDHVLGFFRIWACSRYDNSAVLGRYVPYAPITMIDFRDLNYDKSRLRWITQPHIPSAEIWNTLRSNWGKAFNEAEIAAAADEVFTKALERVNEGEDLWLFKKKIRGEKDIESLDLHPAVRDYLIKKWRDRIFIEYGNKKFFPVWYFRDSKAYNSFSYDEKNKLEALLEKRRIRSEKAWETQGKKLLSVLVGSSGMLPCAEDLGAVPACVPKILKKLKILGLKVVRWHRDWGKEGQPYVPFEDYPRLSVCTPAVHDSSTVREWWEREAVQGQFAGFLGVPSLPRVYNPGAAKIILSKTASARSRFRVFQIQDLLHLSNNWYAADPASERINVPGTNNDFNWTYRLPAAMEEIVRDKDLIREIRELRKIRAARKKTV